MKQDEFIRLVADSFTWYKVRLQESEYAIALITLLM